MSAALLLESEDVNAFRDEPEAARGAAAALGRRIGLSEQRTGELVLAVAEIGTNLRKHAEEGTLLLRVLRTADVAGVELLAIDSGPGIADVALALRDGESSTGTLGIGLGAVRRLSDAFELHSVPGRGTVLLARFWPRGTPPRLTGNEPAVAGITRPMSGEQECGDAWATRADTGAAPAAAPEPQPQPRAQANAPGSLMDWSVLTGRRARSADSPAPAAPATRFEGSVSAVAPGPGDAVLVMLCDGLGHGPLAATAGREAVNAFRAGRSRTPEQAVQEIHRALARTRGAALAVVRIERAGGELTFCGVGNIAAALVTPDSRTNLLSQPGIVGHQMHRLRTYRHALPEDGTLVMHSDGLSERWRPADLAPVLSRPATLIAAHLLRQAGTRRDDASVVVAKGLW